MVWEHRHSSVLETSGTCKIRRHSGYLKKIPCSRLQLSVQAFRPSSSPSDVDEVNVYTDAIDDYAPTLIGTTNISATTDAAAIALQRARTTGHEIGHALALSHIHFILSLPTGIFLEYPRCRLVRFW